jgi:hypothetical protein
MCEYLHLRPGDLESRSPSKHRERSDSELVRRPQVLNNIYILIRRHLSPRASRRDTSPVAQHMYHYQWPTMNLLRADTETMIPS